MDDFTFRGVSSRAMGAVGAFGESMTIGSRIVRSQYAMPGGGSAEIGEPKYEPTQRSITIAPVDGQHADGPWTRRIVTWLTAGRGKLILDHDPQVYRVAQFDDAPTLSVRSWPAGALEMRMTLQPLAHAVRASSFEMATQGGAAELTPVFATGMKTPLQLTIAPVSTAITAATITVGAKTLELAGLNLTQGQSLLYTAGDTHGAVGELIISSGPSVDGELAFGYCRRWQRLHLGSGEAIRVQVAGGAATVTATLRGRWAT